MAVRAHDQMRLSITTSSDDSVSFVRILGDVDLSDSVQLGHAAEQLVASAAATIYVDLAGTTFMGSTLVAFLVHIADIDGVPRALILCRPTPTASRVIQMTDLANHARQRSDLPPQWPDDPDVPDPTTSNPTERPKSE